MHFSSKKCNVYIINQWFLMLRIFLWKHKFNPSYDTPYWFAKLFSCLTQPWLCSVKLSCGRGLTSIRIKLSWVELKLWFSLDNNKGTGKIFFWCLVNRKYYFIQFRFLPGTYVNMHNCLLMSIFFVIAEYCQEEQVRYLHLKDVLCMSYHI